MRDIAGWIRQRAGLDKGTPPPPFKVLVVDDEPSVLRLVERVLEGSGYITATAPGGAEALEVASTLGSIDLLLTDMCMPNMAGDELARRMRQTDPDLKVLYLTGYSDQLFKEKVTLWDKEAFLDKPCSVKGLQEAVSLLVCGHVTVPNRSGAIAEIAAVSE